MPGKTGKGSFMLPWTRATHGRQQVKLSTTAKVVPEKEKERARRVPKDRRKGRVLQLRSENPSHINV